MAGKTSKKSAKVAKKAAAKRVAAKAATPRKAVATSSAHMSASKRIDQKIADLGDWRGERLAEIRTLIHEVDPEVVEEWKWMESRVWSHEGMYALANAHKDKVKLTFFHGAELPGPKNYLAAPRSFFVMARQTLHPRRPVSNRFGSTPLVRRSGLGRFRIPEPVCYKGPVR